VGGKHGAAAEKQEMKKKESVRVKIGKPPGRQNGADTSTRRKLPRLGSGSYYGDFHDIAGIPKKRHVIWSSHREAKKGLAHLEAIKGRRTT